MLNCNILASLSVRLGEHQLNTLDETLIVKDFNVALIVAHAGYNKHSRNTRKKILREHNRHSRCDRHSKRLIKDFFPWPIAREAERKGVGLFSFITLCFVLLLLII